MTIENEKELITLLKNKKVYGPVLIAGLPASGKTTFTKKLATAFGKETIIIDKDTINPLESIITKSLTGNEFDRDSETYSNQVHPFTMSMLFTGIEAAMKTKNQIIIDAPFVSTAEYSMRNNWSLRERLSPSLPQFTMLTTVFITADSDIRRKRMIQRGSLRDEWKIDNWEEYNNSIKFLEKYPIELCDIRIHYDNNNNMKITVNSNSSIGR